MPVFVALLRGINVGGHNKLPMQGFRDLLKKLNCHEVATYIQSGNAVFKYDGNANNLTDSIATEIERRHGFKPSVLLIDAVKFAEIVEANPFQGKFENSRNMHVSFFQEPATDPDLERMASLAAADEEFELTDSAFYFHAPSGIGRSKLAASVERCLGVKATGRNWHIVKKLRALCSQSSIGSGR